MRHRGGVGQKKIKSTDFSNRAITEICLKVPQSAKRKSRNSADYRIFLLIAWFSVEMGGVEPPSKQGTRKLSTRLAGRFILLSMPGRRQPNMKPSPLILPWGPDSPRGYPFIDDTLFPGPQRAGGRGRVLVATPPWMQQLSDFTW